MKRLQKHLRKADRADREEGGEHADDLSLQVSPGQLAPMLARIVVVVDRPQLGQHVDSQRHRHKQRRRHDDLYLLQWSKLAGALRPRELKVKVEQV